MFDKSNLILPRSKESALPVMSWQFGILFAVLCLSLFGLIQTNDWGEVIGLGAFFLFLLWAIAANILDIEEYDNPKLFIGEQGFRFGQKGMPEIPWPEVTAVDFNTDGCKSGAMMTAKVSIRTANDAQWFPVLPLWKCWLLRITPKYEWPKVGLELGYDEARAFAALARIRANLAKDIIDEDIQLTLKKHYRYADGRPIDQGNEFATAVESNLRTNELPPPKSHFLPAETRRCPACGASNMKAVEHTRGGYSSDDIYQCEKCNHRTTIDACGVPYLSGTGALLIFISGVILDWHFAILFISGMWVVVFAHNLYDEWKVPRQHKKRGVSKGFIATLAVGPILLAIILYPNLNPPHPPPYDSRAKAALRAFQTGCSIYWEETETDALCDKETAFKQIYGNEPFPPEWWRDISIQGGGTPKTFSATASHEKSKWVFRIGREGEIIRIQGEVSEY